MMPNSAALASSPFARFTDPAAVRAMLRQHVRELAGVSAELIDCDVLHAWRKTYAKPESWDRSYLNVCYQLNLAAGKATRRALVQGTAFFHHRGAPDTQVETAPDALLEVEGIDLALRRFPSDAKLPQLARLTDTARIFELLPTAALGTLTSIRSVNLTVLNYRPGERCTLRYDIDCGDGSTVSLFAKAFRDDAGERVYRYLHEVSAARGGARRSGEVDSRPARLRVAEPLGYDADTRTVWQRGIRGVSAQDLLGTEQGEAAIGALARSLAALHASALSYERVILREQLVFDARKRVLKLGAAFPQWDDAIRRLVERCASERHALPAGKAAVLHGDAHAGQFLLDGAEAVMCDFDELACGEVEHDLANFCVNLQAQLPANAADASMHALLRAYRECSAQALSPALLFWHYRLQLVSKAYRTFWRQAPGADETIVRLLDLACEADAAAWDAM